MRKLIPLLLVCVASAVSSAAENWPPRADDAFTADIYPSRELAVSAAHAQLGNDARIVEAKDKIVATSTKADGSRELTVSFINKPWAADWSAFTNQTRDNVLHGQSTSPCTSADEAEAAAKRSAIAALLPIVRQRLTQQYSGRRVLSDAFLGDTIDSNLRSQGMIRDRFVQRFTRPYGDVWYATVLVDASQPKVEGIVRDATHLAERRIQRALGIVLAFLLLLAITTLGYILLNWLTKGYFVWRLRFAAMTMLFVAAVAAIAIV